MLAIRLPKDIEARLADLAAKPDRTKTCYAREAILEYIDDLEDVYLVLERIEKPGRRMTMEQVEQALGLGD
jgi:RHH-type transcriptional regulator, rel operon repressor / antitoxin RelB